MRWSSMSDLIVTGGEDCRYRLWDGHGRPLFSSSSHGYPITCVEWSPTGDLFAVGSHNILRLSDKAGVSNSRDAIFIFETYSNSIKVVTRARKTRIGKHILHSLVW